MIISISGLNSFSTCLQAPQGGVKSSVGAYKKSLIGFENPLTTKLNIAIRSAHTVSPKDAFSTFTPVAYSPFFPSTRAATGNFEYGQ